VHANTSPNLSRRFDSASEPNLTFNPKSLWGLARSLDEEMAKKKTTTAITPEGPYEDGNVTSEGIFQNRDVGRFMDFFTQLQEEAKRSFDLSNDQREMPIILDLINKHFAGRLMTSSSLAANSGLSYGTAIRTIRGMMKRGLILKRPRTSTGKSASLHPSDGILSRWHIFSHRGEKLARSLSAQPSSRSKTTKRQIDADAVSRIIPPPTVLETKLDLGRSLRVLVHADPTFSALQTLKRQFEMILGVNIESRVLAIDQLQSEIINNSERAASKYDIIACDLPWFGEMAVQGRLLPLAPLMQKSGIDVKDIYADALASSRYRGKQFGVPIMTTAEVLVYRTDILAEAGIDPPRTAAATIEAARKLHRPSKAISGIAWNGGRGTPIGHSFMMVMSAFGRPIVNLRKSKDGFDAENAKGEELRPTFLSVEARETAEYLLELKEYSPPNILSMAWYDRAIAYAKGNAAMAYSHSLLAQLFETDPTSPAYRRTGYLPHPTGSKGKPIVPIGGYALSIPANIAPRRIASVWTALQSLTSARAVKLYLFNGSLASPRISVSRDPEVQAISPFIGAVDDFAARGYLRMWPRPPIPGISDIIAVAGEEIHDLLAERKTITDALTRAQNRADRLMRSRGHY
jgi:multiple sugar transport system substrate-binding protein